MQVLTDAGRWLDRREIAERTGNPIPHGEKGGGNERKTVIRDIDALVKAEIPVEIEKLTGDGCPRFFYRLRRGWMRAYFERR